jgi:GGDEF domain-containing protein
LCSQIARLTAETPLTVSVGLHTCQVDTWPPSDTVVQALLTHADIALYNAKRAGGNTVSTHQ